MCNCNKYQARQYYRENFGHSKRYMKILLILLILFMFILI